MAGEDWRMLATRVADGLGPWRLPTQSPTRTQQLLTLAARTQVTDDQAAQIRSLGEQFSELEWNQLQAQAHVENLAPLVYAQVAAVGLLPLMPPAVYTHFAAHYRDNLLTNLHIRTILEWLLDQANAAGVIVMPLKGIVLVERVYHNPGWRHIGDIDLLVRREDVGAAGRLLRTGGYLPKFNEGRAEAFWATTSTETGFNRDQSPIIELHWGMSKRPDYRRRLPTEKIWARTHIETWRGRAIRVLDRSDELRYLAIHCTADHPVSPLHWLVDIAEMVRALPTDWDWDDFAAETIASGVATPVGLALAQCHAVLDVDVPEEALVEMLQAALAPDERAAWRSAWADILSRRWIITQLRAIPSRRARARFALGALARVSATAAHLWHPPSP